MWASGKIKRARRYFGGKGKCAPKMLAPKVRKWKMKRARRKRARKWSARQKECAPKVGKRIRVGEGQMDDGGLED